jgi:predicted peptidase
VRQEKDALIAAGSAIKYTEYKGAPHGIWDTVYADQNMWTWLWAQHR